MTEDLADLAQLLGRRESATLEFKRQVDGDLSKIRQVICALANDLPGVGGGDLIIGVDDDGSAYPVDVTDDALLRITNIRNEGRILEMPRCCASVRRGMAGT